MAEGELDRNGTVQSAHEEEFPDHSRSTHWSLLDKLVKSICYHFWLRCCQGFGKWRRQIYLYADVNPQVLWLAMFVAEDMRTLVGDVLPPKDIYFD